MTCMRIRNAWARSVSGSRDPVSVPITGVPPLGGRCFYVSVRGLRYDCATSFTCLVRVGNVSASRPQSGRLRRVQRVIHPTSDTASASAQPTTERELSALGVRLGVDHDSCLPPTLVAAVARDVLHLVGARPLEIFQAPVARQDPMLTKPTTLAHRHSSPNTVFLTCLKRPSQAVALNRARSADVPRGVRLI